MWRRDERRMAGLVEFWKTCIKSGRVYTGSRSNLYFLFTILYVFLFFTSVYISIMMIILKPPISSVPHQLRLGSLGSVTYVFPIGASGCQRRSDTLCKPNFSHSWRRLLECWRVLNRRTNGGIIPQNGIKRKIQSIYTQSSDSINSNTHTQTPRTPQILALLV